MATWKRSNGTPVTVENEVAVFCEETGDEGLTRVIWSKGFPHFGSVVYKANRFYDENGQECQDPETIVIDQNPVFA